VGILKFNRTGDVQKQASVRSEDRNAVVRFWDSYHKATELLSLQRFEEATDLYRQALEENSEHEDSLYYLGNCLFELGDFKSALDVYRRLVNINPRSHRGFSQLGVTLSTLEPGAHPDYSEARWAFDRVLEVDPEESGPLLRLGWLSLQEHKLEEAYEHFQKAAGFASPEGHFWSGFVRFQQRRYSEAIDHFLGVVTIAEHEKRISSQGGQSEGDLAGSGTAQLSPLRKAELKAQLFLYWATRHSGGYPAGVDKSARLVPPSTVVPEKIRLSPQPANSLLGRGVWGDFDGDGTPELAIASENSITISQYRNGGFVQITELTLPNDSGSAWDLGAADFGQDGRDDLYLVGSGFRGTAENRFFRSESSAGREVSFVDSTQEVGLTGKRSTIRALTLDLNNDGWEDILELGSSEYGPPLRIYMGSPTRFRDATADTNIAFEGVAVEAALGDFDGDSDQDLFVLRWKRPGLLFRNEGDGTFFDVTTTAGLDGVGGHGYSTLFIDYDRDGRPDLLVTSQAPYEATIACLVDSKTSVKENTPRLFRNLGGRFQEVTAKVGLNRSYGVFQAVVEDFDQDGWQDLLFANGGLDPTRLGPSVLLKNEQGKSFTEALLLPGLEPVSSIGASAENRVPGGGTAVYLAGVGLFRLFSSPP